MSEAPNSLRGLLQAYARLREAGRHFAVASVVRVEGSAFRREGARLLVVPEAGTDFGAFTSEPHTWAGVPTPRTIGSISGGCLEAEVAACALDVMRTDEAHVVAFRSRLGSADRIGYGLGCGGAVSVLIQAVASGRAGPLDAVVEAVRERRLGALASVIDGPGVGRHLFVEADGRCTGDIDAGALQEQVLRAALAHIEAGDGGEIQACTASGHRLVLRLDVITPPLRLVVCGTGPAARALVRQAAVLGWETVAVGAGSVPEVALAVPEADRPLVAGSGSDLLARLRFDARTAAVVMTHNFDRDRDLVVALTGAAVTFVGLLGSRRRTASLLGDLEASGRAVALGRLHTPVGLDLGAETPEEIALATCAQILGVFRLALARSTFPDAVLWRAPAATS